MGGELEGLFLFLFLFFWWGKGGKCFMHHNADRSAPCVGLQNGVPVGQLPVGQPSA